MDVENEQLLPSQGLDSRSPFDSIPAPTVRPDTEHTTQHIRTTKKAESSVHKESNIAPTHDLNAPSTTDAPSRFTSIPASVGAPTQVSPEPSTTNAPSPLASSIPAPAVGPNTQVNPSLFGPSTTDAPSQFASTPLPADSPNTQMNNPAVFGARSRKEMKTQVVDPPQVKPSLRGKRSTTGPIPEQNKKVIIDFPSGVDKRAVLVNSASCQQGSEETNSRRKN